MLVLGTVTRYADGIEIDGRVVGEQRPVRIITIQPSHVKVARSNNVAIPSIHTVLARWEDSTYLNPRHKDGCSGEDDGQQRNK